jgi:hypothetical protein
MTILAYAACFLALTALAGLAAATGRRWELRLPLLAATPLLALAVWWQLSQRDGWPTDSHPVNGAAFVASVVQAPTPSNAGAIYLWAQPPDSNAPRAYRLAYSPQLERQVAHAASAARRGVRVAVHAPRRRRGTKQKGRGQQPSAVLEFYRLPPPGLPVKDQSASSSAR